MRDGLDEREYREYMNRIMSLRDGGYGTFDAKKIAKKEQIDSLLDDAYRHPWFGIRKIIKAIRLMNS